MSVELQDLSFSYPGDAEILPLFHCLNLTFRSNMIYALTGPSGSGKSTLLKIIGGLFQPSQGCVHCDKPQTFGYVPQESSLFPWLTVRQNLGLGAKLTGATWDNSDMRTRLATELGLDRSLDKRTNTLSVGMKQRTALISALTSSANIILLDEPFAGSDRERRRKMYSAILQHQAEREDGIVIVATHDVVDIFALGATAILLPTSSDGSINIVTPQNDWDLNERSHLGWLMFQEVA